MTKDTRYTAIRRTARKDISEVTFGALTARYGRIVVGDLFEIASKRVSDEGDTKEDSALTLLKSRKASLEKRLKNLYLLYSDSEEDTILELIIFIWPIS